MALIPLVVFFPFYHLPEPVNPTKASTSEIPLIQHQTCT